MFFPHVRDDAEHNDIIMVVCHSTSVIISLESHQVASDGDNNSGAAKHSEAAVLINNKPAKT